jgi:circadian clock protein KaiC
MHPELPSPLTAGIQKMPSGLTDFDDITYGGLPRHRTTLLIGTPGSGKTVLALQMLVNGAKQLGEPGIFVAFEENSLQLIQNAATFGWDLPTLERERLFFLDARMSPDAIQAGDFDLIGMLASLKAKADEMGAKRIVFDSVDVLLALLDDGRAERRELYRIHDWLAASGLTGVLTARSDGLEPFVAARYNFLQFMADCVVFLQHDVREDISRREVRVLKYRGSKFAENAFPLVIGSQGVEIFGPPSANANFPIYTERVSSGIQYLDTLLNGGFIRGTTILLTGLPGTAKTTLGGVFLEAACRRGERALFVSIDESSGEIVRNLASVGIDLQSHLDSGLLQIYWSSRESRSAEEHLITLRRFIAEHQPQCLVVNPLWMMLQSGTNMLNIVSNTQRLMLITKNVGITTIFTSLSARPDEYAQETPYQISTLADAWIHLSYMVQGGEWNRGLTIVKARGVRHANQIYELRLNNDGITLRDNYTVNGQVLMGSVRHERETDQQLEREHHRLELEKQRRELELAEAEINARIQSFQLDLEAKRAALRLIEFEQAQQRDPSSQSEEGQNRQDAVLRKGAGKAAADVAAADSAPTRGE